MLIATATSAAQAFTGAWDLVSFTEYSEGKEPVEPLGSNPVGFLIYTVDGLVSAQLMKPGRKPEPAGAWDYNNTEGLAELAAGYIAYCGRYFIDETTRQIIHQPIVALIPNLIDERQYRNYSFREDELELETFRKGPDGKIVKTRLLWRRHKLEPNANQSLKQDGVELVG